MYLLPFHWHTMALELFPVFIDLSMSVGLLDTSPLSVNQWPIVGVQTTTHLLMSCLAHCRVASTQSLVNLVLWICAIQSLLLRSIHSAMKRHFSSYVPQDMNIQTTTDHRLNSRLKNGERRRRSNIKLPWGASVRSPFCSVQKVHFASLRSRRIQKFILWSGQCCWRVDAPMVWGLHIMFFIPWSRGSLNPFTKNMCWSFTSSQKCLKPVAIQTHAH